MKFFSKSRASSILLIVFVTAICGGVIVIGKQVRELTKEDVAGTWIGPGDGQLYYYRLQLSPDDSGILAWTYLRESVSLFRITQWKIEHNTIYLRVVQVSGIEAQVKSIEAKVVSYGLELQINGQGWNEKGTLMREDDVKVRDELARKAVAEYEKKNK
jgi:hypothetical protein